jgi:hypothetical protein
MHLFLLLTLGLCWQQARAQNLTLADLLTETPKCAVRSYHLNVWLEKVLIKFAAFVCRRQCSDICFCQRPDSFHRVVLKYNAISQRFNLRTKVVQLARASQHLSC